jgi:hypothetical protein
MTHQYISLLADPTVYNIEGALQSLIQDPWTINQLKRVNMGDRVIIWKSLGKDRWRGVVGFGIVVEDTYISSPHLHPNIFWMKPPQIKFVNYTTVAYIPHEPIRYSDYPEALDLLKAERSQGIGFYEDKAEDFFKELGIDPDDIYVHNISNTLTDKQSSATVPAFDPRLLTAQAQYSLSMRKDRVRQADFRADILRRYANQCVMSGCDVVEALEGAHIVPFNGEDTNHVENGIPLRGDLHTLFDRYLISINPDTYTIQLAHKLRGGHYGHLHDQPLRFPNANRPSKAALELHWQGFNTNP